MMNWAEHFQAVSKRNAGGAAFGASFGGVSSEDVIAYRSLWDPYVMGTARALLASADAWDKAADAVKNGQTPTGINVEILNEAIRGIPESYSSVAIVDRDAGQALAGSWNQHAGADANTIAISANDFLRDFQSVVSQAQQFQLQVRKDSPQALLPVPPPADAQASLATKIQGGPSALIKAGVATTDVAAHLPPLTSLLPSKTTLVLGGIALVAGGIVLWKVLK